MELSFNSDVEQRYLYVYDIYYDSLSDCKVNWYCYIDKRDWGLKDISPTIISVAFSVDDKEYQIEDGVDGWEIDVEFNISDQNTRLDPVSVTIEFRDKVVFVELGG